MLRRAVDHIVFCPGGPGQSQQDAQILKDHLVITIPFDLAGYVTAQRKLVRKYETNQVIKALDLWLVLKHETTSGIIQDWNEQKSWLVGIAKCSESIFRHRLKVLQSLGIASYDRHTIRLCSWTRLAELFSIDTTQRLTIQYNFNDKQRVQEWLIAAEIQDNKNRQDIAIIAKLNKNPGINVRVSKALIAAGADESQLSDMNYLLTWLRIVYRTDFIAGSDLHEVMIDIRPDNNRGVKGMARAWNAKSPVTVSYWKAVLSKSKVIDVGKLQVQSDTRQRNKECCVLWIKETKQTMLCLCDSIELIKPRDHSIPILVPEAA